VSLLDCTVLVVEDHEFQRATTLQILANLGVSGLSEAADAESALTLLEDGERPDVIVCDLDMPGMDGIEFLRRVADLGAGTGIIVASGLDASVLKAAEVTARGFGLVVLGTIPKPLTARRLLQAIGLHRPAGWPVVPEAWTRDDPWRAALAEERVGVRVQPRVDLASGRVAGLEVRAHCRDQGGAIVDAVDSGRGPAAMRSAMAVAQRVARAGLEAQQRLAETGELVDITLVIPSGALADDTLAEFLSELTSDFEIEPARVCVAVADADLAGSALELLTRLRVRGFGLGFDGFGRVGATLPALDALPLTEVKIDADGVGRATATPWGVEAFVATVQMFVDRGLDVIGDGCASGAEWLVALQAGCRRAQGAYIGPALAPEDVAGWLHQRGAVG
jgi:EAL domain-containing protein (putative c-di-GMP-specific phosphodiesterase class I)